MCLVIRKATLEDAELIARAISDGVHGNPPAAVFLQHVISEGTLYHVSNVHIAELNGDPVGCINSYDGDDFEAMFHNTWHHAFIPQAKPGEYHIDTVWIDEHHRRHGYGSQLCEFAMNLRGNKNQVTLTVGRNEEGNIAFYHRLGFEIIDEQPSRASGYYLMRKEF